MTTHTCKHTRLRLVFGNTHQRVCSYRGGEEGGEEIRKEERRGRTLTIVHFLSLEVNSHLVTFRGLSRNWVSVPTGGGWTESQNGAAMAGSL